MIKNFEILADRLKGVKIGDKEITADLLKDVLSKDDPFELVATQMHVMDEAELTGLKSRMKKEGYEEGRVPHVEMLIKELKQEQGLDFEGKDPKKFVSELVKKIEREKGIEPNKKIQELTESLTKLQELVQAKDNEVKGWEGKYTGLQKETMANELIMSKLPQNIKGVTPKHFTTLLKADGYSVDIENGEPVVSLHGKVLKDKMEKALPVDSVLLDYAKQNQWIDAEGRGGSGGGGGAGEFKTMSDVFKHMETNKIDPMSTQGIKLQEDFQARTQA